MGNLLCRLGWHQEKWSLTDGKRGAYLVSCARCGKELYGETDRARAGLDSLPSWRCPDCGQRWWEMAYDACLNCGWVAGTPTLRERVELLEGRKTSV